MPRPSSENFIRPLSKSRMTMPSPCSIGITDTRTSISRPDTRSLMRPSCGKPLLGDVQPGHDLEAADDRGLEAVDLRRHRLRVQHAVDAVANLDAGGLRLDVDVARPRFDRLDQNFVHQPNDRRFLGLFGQLAIDVDLVEKLDVLFVLLGHQVVDRLAADAQVGLDLPGDLLALGQHRLDREAGRGAQLIERVEIERVARGDAQRAVLPLDRETANGDGSA